MTGGTDRQKASDQSYLTDANEACANLEAAASNGSIQKIDGETAQSLANLGYTVVAAKPKPSGRGHLNTVASSEEAYDSSIGPLTSDVGGKPGGLRNAKEGFGGSLEGVSYYYYPAQDRTTIDKNQTLNKWEYDDKK